MVRATIEDGKPLPAIVLVQYKIMYNADLSGWPASIICPKDQWTPYVQELVYRVVTRYGGLAHKRTAVCSYSERHTSSGLAPKKYRTEAGTDKAHTFAMLMKKPRFILTELHNHIFTVLGVG